MIIIEMLVLIIGICIGSFLNICIDRMPKNQSIAFSSFRCQTCQHSLMGIDLIPILSYLGLKGKCRYCEKKISLQYPIIELLNGVLYVGLYLQYSLTPIFFALAILGSLLLVITIIDLKCQIIPDELIIFGLAVCIPFHITSVYGITFLNGIGGFLIGGGIFLAIALVTNGAMGGGDIKLMAMLGLWFGITNILIITMLAFFIGAIISILLLIFKIKNRKDMIPFGPFIALATIIVVF